MCFLKCSIKSISLRGPVREQEMGGRERDREALKKEEAVGAKNDPTSRAVEAAKLPQLVPEGPAVECSPSNP